MDFVPLIKLVGPGAGTVLVCYVIFHYTHRGELQEIKSELSNMRAELTEERKACADCRADLAVALTRLQNLQDQIPFLTMASNRHE